tara:strand:- start:496 stop:1206 length:711 start_codon:yes stop_codon:yes gene_type:complete
MANALDKLQSKVKGTLGLGSADRNTAPQPSDAPTQVAVPDYIQRLDALPCVEMSKDPDYAGEYSFVVSAINLVRGKKKDTVNLFIQLLATSVEDEENNYVYTEERTVSGVKNLGELRFAFGKARGYEIAKTNRVALYPELMNALAQKGWTKQKLLMQYRPDTIIKKLGHIIKDSGLQEWFESEKLNILALEGQTIMAKLSERGALMSLSGESRNDDYESNASSQDNIMVDDTDFNF